MLVNDIKIGKGIVKKTKSRIWACVCLAILGGASLYVGCFIPLASGNSDFSEGFYVGLGSALIVTAIIKIIQYIRLLKNKEALKKREIYEEDERNKMIGLKTWSYSGYVMFVLLYVGIIVAGIFNVVVMKTLLVVTGVYAICLFVSLNILQKKM